MRMKMKFYIFSISLIFILSCMSLAQDNPVSTQTSNEAILKTTLRSLNLNDPAADLEINIINNDFRFISICGFACYAPGVSPSENAIIEKWGARLLEGTSDVIESDNHGRLISLATEYAEKYNKLLITKMKEKP